MTGNQPDPVLHRKLDEAWRLLEDNGQAATARSIRERFEHDTATTPTVVVVGEAKRGKSSLINALVGAEVAPIGVDIVTGAYVAYIPFAAEHEVAPGRARLAFTDGSSDDIPLEQLAGWVTVAGEHAHSGVVSATARLQAPAALDVILVDTPGVGSLVAGHGDLALRAAREATALIFVVDAGQDFTAPEKGFLEQAAASIDTVIFAVTKIDKHPTSWEETVARDQSLLARHAPRFAGADMIGVSSTMALEAAAEDDPEVVDVLQEESRLGLLLDAVTRRVAARADQLATANVLRATVTALDAGAANLRERIGAIKSSEETAQAATAERDELKELQKQSQRWGREFDLTVNRLRRALVDELSAQASDIEHGWRGRLAELKPAALRNEDAQREQLTALAGEIAQLSGRLLDEYVAALNTQILELFAKDLERAAGLAAQLRSILGTQQSAEPGELAPVVKQGLGQYVLRSGMSGFGLANLAGFAALKAGILTGSAGGAAGMMGGMAALGPLAIPAVAVFGLTMAFTMKSFGDAEAVRTQLREHGAKALQRMQQSVLHRVDGITAELRLLLLDAMESYITDRAAQLNDVIKEANQAMRAAPMERTKRIQPLQKTVNTFAAAVADFEGTLRRMSVGTSTTGGASKQQMVTAIPGSPW